MNSAPSDDAVYGALHKALDQFSAFAEHSTRSLRPRAVLAHPPANRKTEAEALSSVAARLEIISTACRSACHRLSVVLARLERSKHDCQLALSPVCALPDEILSQIFELVALSRSSDVNTPSLTSSNLLTQVCSTWRAVAQASSALWTDLCVDQTVSIRAFNQAVRLSKARPLRLTVRDQVPKMPLEMKLVSRQWMDAVEELDWSSSADPVDSLVDTHAYHNLRSFSFGPRQCGLCKEIYLIDELFHNADFPELRHLALEYVDLSALEFVDAPLLLSLHLHAITVDPNSLDNLLNGLGTLETLILDCIRGSPSEGMTFRLPRLRSLTTKSVTRWSRRHFLDPHRYPALREWHYHNGQMTGEDPDLPGLLTNFVGGSRNLEEITAHCDQQLHRSIFEALSGVTTTITSSSFHHRLRLLSVSIPRRAVDQSQHLHQEGVLIARIGYLLRNRADRGLPALEDLIFHLCPGVRTGLFPLQALVGRLKIEACEVFRWRSPSPGL